MVGVVAADAENAAVAGEGMIVFIPTSVTNPVDDVV
jgi:hypothetical protein